MIVPTDTLPVPSMSAFRAFCFLTVLLTPSIRAAEPEAVDFSRDIRPILSNSCFKCHGPATQKAKLRLDLRDAALKNNAFVPGKPADSEILARLTADDDSRMPPLEVGERLKPEQIEKIRKWIASGAEYTPHWAFVPPIQKQTVEPNGNAIDVFIRQRLERVKLAPSPEADSATLIRRVSLDLTGLPPSPDEVDAFVRDPSTDAYTKVVDRLLASPHYGERQARHWLDLARYADSNGYTIDGARIIWPWRDWVVKAMNDDMPFDRFTIEQLAGDLLPNPTLEQRIATGFHRNTSFNEEGGTDAEQFRVERIVDRTNTTAAVWLGLTMGCAQCHDHKYDPVSQKDYYRLYAYFNNCDEPTVTIGGSPELEKKIAELMARIVQLQKVGDQPGVDKTKAEIKKVQGKIPSSLVLKERAKPRESFVQIRGDFLRKGDTVTPGTPSALPVGNGQSRLDLARWLVSRSNPLTARVVVNRYWQQFFGRGLVETENDFGMQGSLPTHPELLDWLAVEFMEPKTGTPWSMKRIHKLIVMSATYRQASHGRSDTNEKDPRNLYLSRQSRLRLEAEGIRDAALSASGLLSKKIGGAPVYPPQPAEVFSFTQSKHAWPESKGEDRYRRGLYTYIWRQSQHPLMTTFDGADAQTTCTKRNRSNTPLQALHLANDPAFVEFAEGLGKRIVKDGPTDDAGRVRLAYRICFGREPTEAEADRVAKYAATVPETKRWTAVGRVLLNLDEFITRE
jgi:mono/diheme cytochrome c family protein